VRAVLVRFGGIILLAGLALWLYCVLDAMTSDRQQVRALPKGVWVAVVLVTFVPGALAWLAWGRPRATTPRRPTLGSSGRTAWPARPGRPGPPPAAGGVMFGRPPRLAPDDDPEFLAELDRRATQEHEKLLGSWEDDLRKREEQLRRERGTEGREDPADPDAAPPAPA
jgi:hypothetical protein